MVHVKSAAGRSPLGAVVNFGACYHLLNPRRSVACISPLTTDDG
jgi:hypothetical protein